jgi:hypothetical protein
MAVIALTSANGSPGVTTTALGMALLWPRPVLLVEADPTGGSALLAGYFQGTREYAGGLIELALTADTIHDGLAEVSQRIDGSTVSFVAGPRTHTQAPALRDLWQPLSEEIAGLEAGGQDVIVDAGRLGLVGSPEPLLANADLTLIVTRTNLTALAAVRSWADSIQRGTLDWQQPGLLVAGDAQPYNSRELASVLGLPVVAEIADDPTSAAVFAHGATPPKKFDTGPLARSLHAAIASIHAAVSRHRSELMDGAHP